tara:strand:+ start:109 stop:549 length:441 start_codon:yes stop_codon:yes gene_type:complete
MKTFISSILLILTINSVYAGNNCEVKYEFDSSKSWNDRSWATDYNWMQDHQLYTSCKEFCEINVPEEEPIKTTCLLFGENIESSKYKDIYLNNKDKFCTITTINKKTGSKGIIIEVDENLELCNKRLETTPVCSLSNYDCTVRYAS